MVGKKATTDGSVITCHSCDGNYRTWLNIVPHRKYDPGAMRKVSWGLMHNEFSGDKRNVTEKGEIPQVAETYSYLNTCYPSLNEKQLAMGETTFGGKGSMENDDGLFLIEELQAIAMERCTNARDAIKLMGDLATQYGYGDSGECLTVADKNEVWQFEIMGAGVEKTGAVWAAVRIPDDHVGVSANICRISTLDLSKPDYYMASENVISLAEEMGFYDKKSGEPFKFWKAYGGRKPFFTREFYILSTMAPSLNLTPEMDELPFSVKAEKKVSVRDVMAYYRNTYEGTDLDATKNLMVARSNFGRRGAEAQPATTTPELVKSALASPFMSGDLRTLVNTLKPGTIESQRTIAISGCSYSNVIQCRDWLPDDIGGVAWFSFDNPACSPRIPIYAGTLSLPESFEICGQKKFRTDAAIWNFRETNRLAELKWERTRNIVDDAVKAFEDQAFIELPLMDKMAVELMKADQGKEPEKDQRGNLKPPKYREFMTQYTNNFARATMTKWVELKGQLWTMYARGF
ncbi:MAG: peptidase [Porphyromonadaceae bacterium]|nr:MAG: peptidase [Porphyromonadaceae bacterium]